MAASKSAAFLALTAGVARAAVPGDAVASLPGFSGDLPSKLYSGYVPSNPGKVAHYMYSESLSNPTADPVVAWFNVRGSRARSRQCRQTNRLRTPSSPRRAARAAPQWRARCPSRASTASTSTARRRRSRRTSSAGTTSRTTSSCESSLRINSDNCCAPPCNKNRNAHS